MKGRNRYIHAVEVLSLSRADWKALHEEHWQPKDDEVLHASADDLAEVANQLRDVGGWSLRYVHAARNWGSAYGQAPPRFSKTVCIGASQAAGAIRSPGSAY
jgi:hypothetical protein